MSSMMGYRIRGSSCLIGASARFLVFFKLFGLGGEPNMFIAACKGMVGGGR